MKIFKKDPDAKLSYTRGWAKWLGTDTILTSAWIIDPAGIESLAESNTTTTATIKLGGGIAGNNYIVTNRIVTAAGDTDDRSWQFRVASR